MAYYQPSNCQVNCNTVETLTTNMNGWAKQSSYAYDQYNNVSSETDSDWGTSGSPGGTLRVTTTTYNTTVDIINDRMLGLPAEIKVYDGSNNLYTDTKYNYDGTSIANDPGLSGTYHDNANFGGSQVRGNLTSIQQCLMNSGTCTWLNTSMGYDIAGNLMSVTDANNHTTWFSYSDNYTDGLNRNSYAFLTSVTNALGQSPFQGNYDYHLGQPVLTADIMGQYTTHSYGTSGFATDRLIEVSYANGGNSYYSYPSARQIITQQDQNTSGDQALMTETQNDGFGRLVESDVFENPSQYIAVTWGYDGLGRVTSVTNPSRWTNGQGDGLGYATTYSYDGWGGRRR
jgi:hypothetical protein